MKPELKVQTPLREETAKPKDHEEYLFTLISYEQSQKIVYDLAVLVFSQINKMRVIKK